MTVEYSSTLPVGGEELKSRLLVFLRHIGNLQVLHFFAEVAKLHAEGRHLVVHHVLVLRTPPLVGEAKALGKPVPELVIVAAFSLYGADDSETEDALLFLMTASAECPPSIDPPKNASPFRDCCRAIAEQYDLSPREARETRRGVGEGAALVDSVLH